MKKYSARWLMGICILLVAGTVRSDVLVAWNVEGINVASGSGLESGTSPYPFSVTNNAMHTTGILTLGSGVNPSNSTNQYGFKISYADQQTTLDGAIANHHYIQFTLVADAGYRFDLASIALNAESTGAGADNIALLSNIEGFAGSDAIDSLSDRQGLTGGWDADEWAKLDEFSGNADYEALTAVTFRLYGWNSSSSRGVTRIRNLSGNDLVVHGTIEAVPEPAVMGFVLLTGIGALAARRFVG